MTLNKSTLTDAANQARGIAIDAVYTCNSGHLGLPLGTAEIGAVLFGVDLHIDAEDPRWINRDRFILSAGHGSMFLYTWLHLAGFDISREDLAKFRALHSKTPGHPEFHDTPGVEATTGPLGQGIANAVGYAISGQMAAATYNTANQTIFNHHTFVLAGDGCMQEGVAMEAASLAGHLGLDHLILIYDSNDVTLDAMAETSQSEDPAARFKAMRWDVTTINGHSITEIHTAVQDARRQHNGRPKLIIARTEIGRGIPQVAGTQSAHGESGAKFAADARAGLGLPAQPFYVSPDVETYFAKIQENRAADRTAWNATYASWQTANPALATQLQTALSGQIFSDWADNISGLPTQTASATRNDGGVIIQTLAQAAPNFLTGSADLFGSTKNYLKGLGDYSRTNHTGRNIWFGIREHAMASICNGMAYDGLFRVSCATFLVFADYLRPAIRLAALSKLPVLYIFTHDSVGVGEDGPTHQPVETISGLRVIPGLDVIRPSDAEETVGAFLAATDRVDGPTLLALSRQNLPQNNTVPAAQRRQGVLQGAYIAKKETADLRAILISTGSELQHALTAAATHDDIRVVSMPCMERFDRQPKDYRDAILPPSCTKRIAMEAGVSGLWWKYVGTQGSVIGIDRFGLSAPGDTVMAELGMTPDSFTQALS